MKRENGKKEGRGGWRKKGRNEGRKGVGGGREAGRQTSKRKGTALSAMEIITVEPCQVAGELGCIKLCGHMAFPKRWHLN